MNQYLQISILLAVTILTSGCRDEDRSASAATRATPMNTIYPLNKVINKPAAYPYEMSAEEKKHLLDNLKTLHPGQSYDEVVKLLGPPYSQYQISAKEHDRPLGIRVTYYLKKLGDGVNVRYDQDICLTFSNEGYLKSISTENIPGLLGFDNESWLKSNYTNFTGSMIDRFEPKPKEPHR